MNIWVTRSEPGASALAQLLKEHGFSTTVAPVLQIGQLKPRRVFINGQQFPSTDPATVLPPSLVIALSAHAVETFLASDLLAYTDGVPFVAVGVQTAGLLQQAGIDTHVPELMTSEGIVDMPELGRLEADQTVWVLAGKYGRDLLLRHLQDVQHCRVVKFELYERQVAVLQEIDDAAIDAVVVSSVQGLEAFSRYWQKVAGGMNVSLIVPSARVATRAGELGFGRVHTAQNATAPAILEAVQQLA